MRSPQDSTGRTIKVGDRVNWRGQIYTIKAFNDSANHDGMFTIDFEEPLHFQGEIPDEIAVDLVREKAVTPAFQDPVEDQYPRRSLCPACRESHPVHADGDHVGKIVEHEIVDAQISNDQCYACTVAYTCPGSLAKVSKWKRIGR